ncbi:MAG: hypothetical protein GWN84_22405 [Gammaproteobacteria bacterium]|nr:hypothetical protein [Gammaproteobacteria bacterium]NIR85387.1 hypothetical protein [Gammaproteobacteria bacterium]NIR88905.1 hypothetical protein [Gammaproteobacteria bacterium]NIU06513.1 hypothetical protein [Gammaproteobacteria bacterium]NIV53406.1 hypothetical protein [Gammaproteobacteria bacterium]
MRTAHRAPTAHPWKEPDVTRFAYDELEHERLTRVFEQTGRVDVVLSPKRGYLLNAFLRNDRRLRGYQSLNSSGWQVLASFSTAAFLTARIYLFHRKLYEVFPLVAIYDPVVEVSRNEESVWIVSFSRPDAELDNPSEGEMDA